METITLEKNPPPIPELVVNPYREILLQAGVGNAIAVNTSRKAQHVRDAAKNLGLQTMSRHYPAECLYRTFVIKILDPVKFERAKAKAAKLAPAAPPTE